MSEKEEKKEKENSIIGYSFIKRRMKDEDGKYVTLSEVWQDEPHDENKKPTANTWKRIMRVKEIDYNKPVWAKTLKESLKLKEEGYTNVHIESKPSTGPTFLNEKGEICFRMYDEHDHMYTIRMDNPYKLDAQQADKLMKDLTEDCKKELEEDRKEKKKGILCGGEDGPKNPYADFAEKDEGTKKNE